MRGRAGGSGVAEPASNGEGGRGAGGGGDRAVGVLARMRGAGARCAPEGARCARPRVGGGAGTGVCLLQRPPNSGWGPPAAAPSRLSQSLGVPAGRGEGAWAEPPPPLGFHPPRPVAGGVCSRPRESEVRRSRGTAEEQCLALVPQVFMLRNGRREKSFSTEPVRLLLKPKNVKPGNLVRTYRTSLVNHVFCICRFRGLGCKPFGFLSTNLYTCRAGKI